MRAPVSESRIDLTPDAAASYPLFVNESRMVKKYMRLLALREKPEILDVGPVSGNNISFFLSHVSKLHVCDAFSRFSHDIHQNPDTEEMLSFFDYKENSLDGIHVWDICDHLNSRMLSPLVRKLHSLLKPNGLMMLIASTTSGVQPYPLFFVIRDDCAVVLQKVTTRRFPYFYRTNRDIEGSMKPFQQLNSFICTNGVREFLFRNAA
jgi:hypothetical protein